MPKTYDNIIVVFFIVKQILTFAQSPNNMSPNFKQIP